MSIDAYGEMNFTSTSIVNSEEGLDTSKQSPPGGNQKGIGAVLRVLCLSLGLLTRVTI